MCRVKEKVHSYQQRRRPTRISSIQQCFNYRVTNHAKANEIFVGSRQVVRSVCFHSLHILLCVWCTQLVANVYMDKGSKYFRFVRCKVRGKSLRERGERIVRRFESCNKKFT